MQTSHGQPRKTVALLRQRLALRDNPWLDHSLGRKFFGTRSRGARGKSPRRPAAWEEPPQASAQLGPFQYARFRLAPLRRRAPAWTRRQSGGPPLPHCGGRSVRDFHRGRSVPPGSRGSSAYRSSRNAACLSAVCQNSLHRRDLRSFAFRHGCRRVNHDPLAAISQMSRSKMQARNWLRAKKNAEGLKSSECVREDWLPCFSALVSARRAPSAASSNCNSLHAASAT